MTGLFYKHHHKPAVPTRWTLFIASDFFIFPSQPQVMLASFGIIVIHRATSHNFIRDLGVFASTMYKRVLGKWSGKRIVTGQYVKIKPLKMSQAKSNVYPWLKCHRWHVQRSQPFPLWDVCLHNSANAVCSTGPEKLLFNLNPISK